MVFCKSFLLTAISVALIGASFGKSVKNSKDVVWFPNPNNDGSLIEARLYPTPGVSQIGDPKDIHFMLFTGNNPNTPDELFVNDSSALSSSHFIRNKPVKMMFHGFGGAINHAFPLESYREFLEVDSNQNFILVNWTVLADADYFSAVQNSRLTSQASADLIEFLVSEGAVKREDIHLIGFSLGGQVVGQIGSRVSEKLTRITALDPALPMFDVADLHNRTDPTDAIFVDVIHTAANGILGFYDPCGTVDWYPNGGRKQPGCGVDLTGSCGHSRAPSFFLESLRTKTGFKGVECISWENYVNGLCDDNESALLGYYTPLNTTGIFYLTTNEESPYAQG